MITDDVDDDFLHRNKHTRAKLSPQSVGLVTHRHLVDGVRFGRLLLGLRWMDGLEASFTRSFVRSPLS